MTMDVVARRMRFDPSRPYEPLHMTSVLWLEIPPSRIPVDGLVFGQTDLSIAALLELQAPRSFDPLPLVVRYRGEHHVVDGHHRIARLVLRGATDLWCRVKDLS